MVLLAGLCASNAVDLSLIKRDGLRLSFGTNATLAEVKIGGQSLPLASPSNLVQIKRGGLNEPLLAAVKRCKHQDGRGGAVHSGFVGRVIVVVVVEDGLALKGGEGIGFDDGDAF